MIHVAAFYHSLTDSLFDFVFPPLCISCNRFLSDGRQKVCNVCWSLIQVVSRIHPLYIDTREKLQSAGFVSDLVSTFVFEKEGPFQHVAHALKYQGFESLGAELGKRIGGLMHEWKVGAEIIIPIPLHKVKLRERGYNQAEAIARGISAQLRIPVRSDIILRRRHTQTQTKLNLEERRKNMEEAFVPAPAASSVIRGKACLIIDDVITTGATINSCAAELINAGAGKVIAASAALAQKGVA